MRAEKSKQGIEKERTQGKQKFKYIPKHTVLVLTLNVNRLHQSKQQNDWQSGLKTCPNYILSIRNLLQI